MRFYFACLLVLANILTVNAGSVFLIAGGYSAERDIELHHPTIENLNCPTTPPPLNDDWVFHISFYHNQTIHLCGGEKTKSSCISYSRKMSDWKTHSLSPYRIRRHSSVVLRNILYLIGGVDSNDDFIDSVSTPLPLTDTPVLTTIHSLSNAYKGWGHCSMEVDQDNLLIIGGYYQRSPLSAVTQYDISTHTAKALPSLRQERYGHACIMVHRDNKKWVIVTAGYFAGKLDTTEMLELGQSTWISAGRLNVKRTGVSMVDTERGIMVIGGWSRIRSVELMDWSTKRWSLVQPSIKIGRHHYTATEIPLSMFDCVVAVDGGWSNWGEYGQCSKECGDGQQTRTRTCTNAVSQHGGRTCEHQKNQDSNFGDATETKDCNLVGCGDNLRCIYHYNLTSTNGTIIESPGEIHYPDNTSCAWTFAAPEGSRVSLTFLELDTEYGYDIIRVMDKNDTQQKAAILAIISGTTIPETVMSTKHEMRVSFKSDEHITRKGFKAFATILIKEELPKFDWKDKNMLNITFPNGKSELIVMHREKHVDTACIFKGSTNATSVIATLLYSHANCHSISENANVEISVISSHYIEGKKCIFLLKNGQFKQINEPIFVNNGEKVRKNFTGITVPKLIQIPIQFAFDKSLFTKFQVYGRGRDYIVQTIEKLFYQSKWSFEEFSDITKIELVMEKDVLFINKTLKMTKRDHASCRQFQKSENTPTVILIDDDSENYIKGLSFRSGACRKDRERYGVSLVAWRDDVGLTGEVLEHEIGHLIGGIHDHVNGTQTHLEHSPFNSANVNFWFNTTGHRCFGKICPPPPSPQNGDWVCDLYDHSCHLKCEAGFTSPVTTVRCQNGVWEQGTDNVGCTQSLASGSVYFLAGGYGIGEKYYDIELYSPLIQNVQCSIPLPQLDTTGVVPQWYTHHSLYHNNTIYICDANNKKVCLTYNSQKRGFKEYKIGKSGRSGLSVIILRDIMYFIGGSHCNCEPNSTPLPLTDQSVWTAVPNLHYKGNSQCVAKIDEDSFVITGGTFVELRTAVTKYNAKTSVVTSLHRFKHPRYNHACIVVVRDNKKWLIIAGGWTNTERVSLNSTEMLELEMDGSSWISLGDLNEKRSEFSMIETERGIMAMGGQDYGNVKHKTVELLDWVSKQWEVVEPSLLKARMEFGGAVKIPASMFNCKVMSCPALNTNTQNRIGSEKFKNIESMEECSSKCREKSSCEVWTWYKEDAGKEALSCILMETFNTNKMDNSTISAHRNCEIGCPTPFPKQNGIWDCDAGFKKHYKCSLICDPGFSTHRTETKCRDGKWDADIIELECWQEANPINITGCDGEYSYNQQYIGGDVISISSGETCHSVCQSRDDCITWTWTNSIKGTKECHIQKSQGQLEESPGAMSGTKNACKPECYLLLEHHDKAVSTTQYCQQDDVCYDIIRTEPDEFEANDRILVCHEEEEGNFCEDVKHEDVNLICNPDPGTVTLSTFQRINKHRYYGHLKPYFGNWEK